MPKRTPGDRRTEDAAGVFVEVRFWIRHIPDPVLRFVEVTAQFLPLDPEVLFYLVRAFIHVMRRHRPRMRI